MDRLLYFDFYADRQHYLLKGRKHTEHAQALFYQY